MTIETHPSLMTSFRRHRLLLAGVLLVGVAGAGFWLFNGGPSNAVARTEKLITEADGAFRPSETQWGSLRLTPVREVAFRDERATDGKIAINEDTTTPVFSPYSGRVSRLIAKAGDKVAAGAPLFVLEQDFERAALERGVVVVAGESFALGQTAAPMAVRVSLSAARSREELKRGLLILLELLGQQPRPGRALV